MNICKMLCIHTHDGALQRSHASRFACILHISRIFSSQVCCCVWLRSPWRVHRVCERACAGDGVPPLRRGCSGRSPWTAVSTRRGFCAVRTTVLGRQILQPRASLYPCLSRGVRCARCDHALSLLSFTSSSLKHCSHFAFYQLCSHCTFVL